MDPGSFVCSSKLNKPSLRLVCHFLCACLSISLRPLSLSLSLSFFHSISTQTPSKLGEYDKNNAFFVWDCWNFCALGARAYERIGRDEEAAETAEVRFT